MPPLEPSMNARSANTTHMYTRTHTHTRTQSCMEHETRAWRIVTEHSAAAHSHFMIQVFLFLVFREFLNLFEQYLDNPWESTPAGSYQWSAILLHI